MVSESGCFFTFTADLENNSTNSSKSTSGSSIFSHTVGEGASLRNTEEANFNYRPSPSWPLNSKHFNIDFYELWMWPDDSPCDKETTSDVIAYFDDIQHYDVFKSTLSILVLHCFVKLDSLVKYNSTLSQVVFYPVLSITFLLKLLENRTNSKDCNVREWAGHTISQLDHVSHK